MFLRSEHFSCLSEKALTQFFFLFVKVMTKSFSMQEKHDRGTARQYFDYLKITIDITPY